MHPLLFALIAVSTASAQVKVRIERDVVCLARDGVKMRADVYRPDDGGAYPVLLARTPYGKQGVNGEGKARRGYVVVVQDTRGRGRSEGRFDPFMDDERDGYDAVEWAARLPGSNGKVGMFGGSYGGATQVFAAMASPPHLVALFPVFPAIGYGTHNILFEGGAFRQLLASSWAAAQTIELYGRAVGRAGGSRQEFEALLSAGPAADFMETLFRQSMEWGGGAWYRQWLGHAPGSEYWRRTNLAGKVKGIKAAGCYVAGVYDIFGPATAALFSAVQKEAGSEEARRGSQLWWGPWTHGGSKLKPGDTDFGPEPQVSYGKYEDAWFDYWLKGVANEVPKTAPARVFLSGENHWRSEDRFPPARPRRRS